MKIRALIRQDQTSSISFSTAFRDTGDTSCDACRRTMTEPWHAAAMRPMSRQMDVSIWMLLVLIRPNSFDHFAWLCTHDFVVYGAANDVASPFLCFSLISIQLLLGVCRRRLTCSHYHFRQSSVPSSITGFGRHSSAETKATLCADGDSKCEVFESNNQYTGMQESGIG